MNKAKGVFLGPLRASTICVGHSGSVRGTTEPVCIPPGAGKALAHAGEPRNSSLPRPLPPPSCVLEQGCPEGFLLRYPTSGAQGTLPPNQRDPKAASAQQVPVTEATGRDRAEFPAGSCHRAGSESCSSRAPLQPGGNLRPPLAGEFTAGNIQLQTSRCWMRGRTGHPAARDPAMQVMKAPENKNGWCPSVSRAGATEPTTGSFAADTALVACLIAGGWGENELLQVSVHQPQPYLRTGASPYVARLMLAQKASLLIRTHGGGTTEVSCSVSHPSRQPARRIIMEMSHCWSRSQALCNARSTVTRCSNMGAHTGISQSCPKIPNLHPRAWQV